MRAPRTAPPFPECSSSESPFSLPMRALITAAVALARHAGRRTERRTIRFCGSEQRVHMPCGIVTEEQAIGRLLLWRAGCDYDGCTFMGPRTGFKERRLLPAICLVID